MNLSYSIIAQEAKEWIIAYYGYGQHAEVYRNLAEKLKIKFNFLVIDLPYQQAQNSIKKEEFVQAIEALLNKLDIRKVVGLSYSVGSRFNLLMAEYLPEYISKLILVAPDGLQIKFWNKFATSTKFGNYFFRYLVQHRHVFLNLLNFLYKVGLVSKSMYAFSKWHMRDVENRKLVYNIWMNMKHMVPDLTLINQYMKQYDFEIMAYFGEQDHVIGKESIEKLRHKIPSAKVVIINKGHNLLDEHLFVDIAQHLIC